MKLPNASRVIIDPAKPRDYLLSPAHPVGRFKAPFFGTLGSSESAFGRPLTANVSLIRDAIALHIDGLKREGLPVPKSTSEGESVVVEAA